MSYLPHLKRCLPLIMLVLCTSDIGWAQETPTGESIEKLEQNAKLNPDSAKPFDALAQAYYAAGQGQRAVDAGIHATELAKKNKDADLGLFEDHLTEMWFNIAAMQSWLGQATELHANIEHGMEYAADSSNPVVLDRIGKMALLGSAEDKSQVQRGIAFVRRLETLDKGGPYSDWFKMDRGIAEYRGGNYQAAEQDFANEMQTAEAFTDFGCTTAFYRAMCLFRLGRQADAEVIAREAMSIMSPLPADPKNPLANGADGPTIAMWMAYGEAKSLLKMQGPGELEFKQRREAMASMRRLFSEAEPESNSKHMPEAVAHLASASELGPQQTYLAEFVAVFQAWYGQDVQWKATASRSLKLAAATHFATTAERAAKVAVLRPSSDKAQIAAALALARRAIELSRGDNRYMPFYRLSLGMAQYRAGDYMAADAALGEAERLGSKIKYVPLAARLYRAMSLSRQGKQSEAQALFSAAAAKMDPLPDDEKNPKLTNNLIDELIVWMAYKEAKALLSPKSGRASEPHGYTRTK